MTILMPTSNQTFKKHTMRNLTLLIALFLGSLVYSQPPDKGGKGPSREDIKAQKIAFMSSELELTPEEAEKFWPIYNEYEEKAEAIRTKRKGYMKEMRKNDELSGEEMYELTEKIFNSEIEEAELRKEYLAKFASVLGEKKAAMVFFVEEKFKRELLKKIRHGEHPPHDGPPPHH